MILSSTTNFLEISYGWQLDLFKEREDKGIIRDKNQKLILKNVAIIVLENVLTSIPQTIGIISGMLIGSIAGTVNALFCCLKNYFDLNAQKESKSKAFKQAFSCTTPTIATVITLIVSIIPPFFIGTGIAYGLSNATCKKGSFSRCHLSLSWLSRYSQSMLQTEEDKITKEKIIENPQHQKTNEIRRKDLTNKSVAYWECYDREYDPESGGYQYCFKIKDKYFQEDGEFLYSVIEEADARLYPAILNSPLASKRYFNQVCSLYSSDGKIWSNKDGLPYSRVGHYLLDLGYQLFSDSERINKKLTFKVPDSVFFNYKWAQLREKIPGLPELSIIPSNGIADDLEFARVVSQENLILSETKESLHDHLTHIIPKISRILTEMDVNGLSESYIRYRSESQNFWQVAFANLEKVHQIIGNTEAYKCLGVFFGIMADFSFDDGLYNLTQDGDNALVKLALRKVDYFMEKRSTKSLGEEENENMRWIMANIFFSSFGDRNLNELCLHFNS